MNSETIDRISLEQALIDVEVANARTIDLTKRLYQIGEQLAQAQSELHYYKSVATMDVSDLKVELFRLHAEATALKFELLRRKAAE